MKAPSKVVLDLCDKTLTELKLDKKLTHQLILLLAEDLMMLFLQEELGVNPVTLHRPSATRWLSYHQSVDSVRKSYAAILVHLNKQVGERSDAKAAGILRLVKKWRFRLILEMLYHVLPSLAALSKTFQVAC